MDDIATIDPPEGLTTTEPFVFRQYDRVIVFDRPEVFAGWAHTLLQLNCTALRPDQVSNSPFAAILSDTLFDTLGICASLPPALPKILVASVVTFDVRRAAARAGIDTILGRPFEIGELSDWLAQYRAPDGLTPIKILLIDDDEFTTVARLPVDSNRISLSRERRTKEDGRSALGRRRVHQQTRRSHASRGSRAHHG